MIFGTWIIGQIKGRFFPFIRIATHTSICRGIVIRRFVPLVHARQPNMGVLVTEQILG